MTKSIFFLFIDIGSLYEFQKIYPIRIADIPPNNSEYNFGDQGA